MTVVVPERDGVSPASMAPGRRSALRATTRAMFIQGRARAVHQLGPLRPRLVNPANPRIALDDVGIALAARIPLRMAALAMVGAAILHVAFGSWSMSLRPHKTRAARIEMAVAPSYEELAPEVEPPPPPPPETTPSHSSPSTASASAAPVAAPGPILPGIAPATGAGSGLGVAVGAGGGEPPSTSQPTQRDVASRLDAPRPLRRPPPEYPRRARERGVEGFVSLHLLVDARGAVREVRVIDAEPKGLFEEAAVNAVRRWTFEPGREDGNAVEAWVRQVVRFALE